MASTKAKTVFACDTCRKRKSRCDGRRPVCGYCRSNGLGCAYRPLPAQLETDVSVLSRLAEAEARIAALEQHSSVELPDRAGAPNKHDQLLWCPGLHTAAAYKMLNCWPRLRLQLTLPGITAMEYLKASDESDTSLVKPSKHSAYARVMPHDVFTSLEYFYGHLSELPFPLSELVLSSPLTSAVQVLESLPEHGHHVDDAAGIELDEYPLVVLLILSIVFPLSASHDPQLASSCFSTVMQRHWTLHVEAETNVICISLMIVTCLIHQWARPFHALGILQSVQVFIERLIAKSHGDDVTMQSAYFYARIYYILESDLLTEINGLTALRSTSVPNLPINLSVQSLNPPEAISALHSHLSLRSCLNSILGYLYSAEKAYAQPFEIADLVQRSATKLRDWYQSLPLSQQFVRDLATLNMSTLTISLEQGDIALRYFSCIFLLHRPVLYFFLHKTMEFSVRPPDSIAANSSSAPWVLESCRDCIDSAVLIMLLLQKRFSEATGLQKTYFSWFHVQLLFASYLVVLQIRAVPALEQVARRAAEVDDLLDATESIFENLPFVSVQVRTSLEILRNVRSNFAITSPNYSLGSHSPPIV